MIIKHNVIPLNTSSDKNRVDVVFIFWFIVVGRFTAGGNTQQFEKICRDLKTPADINILVNDSLDFV
jgi:hypothetical protein